MSNSDNAVLGDSSSLGYTSDRATAESTWQNAGARGQMMAALFVALAALVSFIARARKVRAAFAWLLGFLIVPSAILIEEFLLPYRGEGASMWPIASWST